MEELPEKSTYSFKKGLWFVFKNEKETIRFWVASFSGVEKMFFNNELVSEKKSRTNFKTKHNYTTVNGDDYEVALSVKIKKKRGNQCVLKKNNVLIGDMFFGPEQYNKSKLWAFAILFFVFTVCVLLAEKIYELPKMYGYTMLGVFWLLFMIVLLKNNLKPVFQDNMEFIDE